MLSNSSLKPLFFQNTLRKPYGVEVYPTSESIAMLTWIDSYRLQLFALSCKHEIFTQLYARSFIILRGCFSPKIFVNNWRYFNKNKMVSFKTVHTSCYHSNTDDASDRGTALHQGVRAHRRRERGSLRAGREHCQGWNCDRLG